MRERGVDSVVRTGGLTGSNFLQALTRSNGFGEPDEWFYTWFGLGEAVEQGARKTGRFRGPAGRETNDPGPLALDKLVRHLARQADALSERYSAESLAQRPDRRYMSVEILGTDDVGF